jgi:putative flippase GtrA
MPAATTLPARLRLSWRLLLKEVGAFGVVGVASLLIDLGLFQVLYAHAGTGAVLAKLVSTVASTTIAYFAHRYWSFSHRARTGVRREYTIFFLVNAATLLLGLAMVAVVHDVLHQQSTVLLQGVNIGSIALGTLLRYLAYRTWVFVAEGNPAAVSHLEQRQLVTTSWDSAAA